MESPEATEALLCKVASKILKKDESQIDATLSFIQQGGNALTAVFMAAKCREAGLLVDMADVSNANKSLRETATKLSGAVQSGQAADRQNESSAKNCQTSVPLPKLQNQYATTGLMRFLMWDTRNATSKENAIKVLESLVARHPLLSASIEAQDDGFRVVKGPESRVISGIDEVVPYDSEEECTVRVKQLISKLTEPDRPSIPVLQVLLFGSAELVAKIALIAPCAAIDAHSWQVLARALDSPPEDQLETSTERASYFRWLGEAELQRGPGERDNASSSRHRLPHVHGSRPQTPTNASSSSHATTTTAPINTSLTLARETTDLLFDESCHRVLRTEASDVIFASLVSSCREGLLETVTRHLEIRDGRPRRPDGEEAAWDSTVGSFDELFDVSYDYRCDEDAFAVCRRAKDSRRQQFSSSPDAIPIDSNCLILDLTSLQRAKKCRELPLTTTQLVSKLVTETAGVLYVLPFWTSAGEFSFTIGATTSLVGQKDINALSDVFVRRIQDTVAVLKEASQSSPYSLPSLVDFPHLPLDYCSLDPFFERLQKITTEPLSDICSVGPCSPIQDNILQANALDSGAYMCTFKVRVSTSGQLGPHDSSAWAAAWKSVIEKHAALRTVFIDSHERPGHFDQVVLRGMTPRIEMVENLVASAANASLPDVTFGPLEVPHHLTIGKEGPSQFLLILTISHAIVDGHSAEVIFNDMCSFIASAGTEEGEAALSFPDYVLDQYPLPDSSCSEESPASDYWIKYLRKTQETHLPVTRETSGLSGFETIKSVIPINVKAVDRLCQQNEVSLASLCQFAWGVVLRTFLGVDNVCFSSIAATRHVPLKGIMTAIGPFITTLLCSMNLESDINVLDAVKAVHADSQESLSHQAEISGAVSTRRWSNTVMSFRRRLVQDDESLTNISCKVVQGLSPTNYDVSLIVSAGQADLEVNLDYWASRMDPELANSLVQSFQQSLHSILRDVTAKVADLELITDEQEQRLVERNGRIPEALDRCVHELINDSINKVDPTTIAIEAWDGTMTYGELNQKASCLSQRLVQMGAKPEIPIGLCMNKSKNVPVAMLAILRSGSAVLPIGIHEPIARVETILADSTPALILCDGGQEQRLQGLGTPLLSIENTVLEDQHPNSIEGGSAALRNSVAWIFFTSGSTGKPKGVLLEHNALATSLRAHGDALRWSRDTRIFQFSAHTFDASVLEVCTTLIYGGCVCIPSDSDRLNDLEGSILRLKVNTLALTSSAAMLITPERVPLVKKLFLFGEAVKVTVVDSWMGQADVFNSYGPTETSILVSAGKPIRTLENFSNIGYPLNVNLWVTDAQNPGRLLPPGAPGELLVEGPLLARGYMHDETKTAAAFIHDPEFSRRLFGANQRRRFYRTGDIVRQNSDFSISYVGRRDKQVKVRGQRLEVAEVEHWVAKSIEGANRAVVGILPALAGEDDTASLQGRQGNVLFAAIEFLPETVAALVSSDSSNEYILPATEIVREVLGKLRDTLEQKLPSYMVPTFFIPFRHIPLTANSKTDLKDILAILRDLSRDDLQRYLAHASCEDHDGGQEPLTKTAHQLNELWAEVLQRYDASFRTTDHFLHQGGDSVAAIRLVEAARRREILNGLTVADIMSHPRLGDLAQTLDERASETSFQDLPEPQTNCLQPFALWKTQNLEADLSHVAQQCGLNTEDIEDVYPCTSLQQAMLIATQQRPTAYFFQQVYGLSQSVNVGRFCKAWEALTYSAPLMRTRILLGQRSGVSLQVLCRNGPTWQHPGDLQTYLSEDRASPMCTGQPLMRFALVRQEAPTAGYSFVWTAHHSVYDGWSAQLIFRHLAAIYMKDEVPPTIQFTGFVNHLQTDISHGDRATTFWSSQLQGDAPSAFPTLPSSGYQPKPVSRIKANINMSLGDISPTVAGLSLANLLRAAWATTLGQYLATMNVVFGATLSGRNAPVTGITELIAPTLNTVPIRIDINPEQTVSEFLRKVQSQAVEMIPFEHTGVEDIKSLLPNLREATDLKHVLIIQPSSMGAAVEDGIQIPGVQLLDTVVEAFDTFALSVQCQLPDHESSETMTKVEVRFDSHVLHESQVKVLLRQFQHWTTQFLKSANQQRRMSSIEGVTEDDLAQIRQQNASAPTQDKTFLHQMVQEMVMKQPHHTSISAWDGTFTYQELHDHASKVAQHLIHQGVRQNVRVGVCMDKSRWAPVAMLGVLAAGGVLVLMGTHESLARHTSTIEDSQTRLLITDDVYVQNLSGIGPRVVVVNDRLLGSLDELASQPLTQICTALQYHDEAWIVYSSGSTGTPKGSLHSHAGLATSMAKHGRATRWSTETRTLQFAAHTFDACLQEIFTTIVFGGCVCIPSEEQRMNSLVRFIRDSSVTHLLLTFSVAGIVNPRDVPSVQQLIVIGEQAKLGVIERWLGHAEILNMYGPSECAICVSRSAPMQTVEDGPNIGFPIDTCNFWITSTSDYNRLCPVGVPGELLIESAWRAKEYVNRPELTATSFVTDPKFMHELGLGGTGRQMYRSGDLIKQNFDGSFTHLGRIGSQVKFRGQRVELGEIEYWISKLLDKAKTVVVDLVDLDAGKGSGDLVAVMDFSDCGNSLFAPGEHQTQDVGGVAVLAPSMKLQMALCDLKDALADKLPSHMVPTAYLPWERIPLSPSGKTDRGAVRRFWEAFESGSTFLKQFLAIGAAKEAPQTEMGLRLRRLWSEVLSLDVDAIGAQDHFTRLGGDSLAAMKLASVAQQHGIHLTVASIFSRPVLLDLAASLECERLEGQEATLYQDDPAPFELIASPHNDSGNPETEALLADVSAQCNVRPEQVQDLYPCTSMQEALFAITAREPSTYTFRQVYKVSRDAVNTSKFEESWRAVASALPILRTRIVLDRKGKFLQAVVDEAMHWHKGSILTEYLARDKLVGFDIGQPLLRCALIHDQSLDGAQVVHFVLTSHHSMFDRFSLERVFYHYVLPTYAGKEMPEIVPYTRFIRYTLKTDLSSASDYWNEQLTGGETFTDFPCLPVSSANKRYQPSPASSECCSIDLEESSNFDVPFPSLLKAGWALTVAQYTAADDVLFAVNLSGRSAPVAGIADITAPTFTTVPVRVRVTRDQKVHDFLRMVHSNAIEMIPFEHIGLQRISDLVPKFSPNDLRHLFLVHPAVNLDCDSSSHLLVGLEEVETEPQTHVDYPLEVMCKISEQQSTRATVEARFDSSVIPNQQMKSILEQFAHNVTQLGKALARGQGQDPIGSLPLANAQDLERISIWNQDVDVRDPEEFGCVHHQVRESAQRFPDAIAIESWDGTLSYSELDQMAAKLAQVLVTERNIGPEALVGLCMDKSRWAVVAMLAILYAGGAVVPLGVQLPAERLQTIVEDCLPVAIICDDNNVSKFEAMGMAEKTLVANQASLGHLVQSSLDGDTGLFKETAGPDNVAWIMYTSGSTGVPKGVALEHRSLSCALRGHKSICKHDSTRRVFQFSAYTFDVSISDIFMTLGCGGVVCIPSESDRMDDLVGSIQRLRVNYLHLTSSTAAMIPPTEVPEVQLLVLGGEQISSVVFQQWKQLSNAKIVNSYGPVECSITSTGNPLLNDATDSANIGKGLPETDVRTWVVDPSNPNRIAPVGAVGELVVEGSIVARGYLNDPLKTSTSFLSTLPSTKPCEGPCDVTRAGKKRRGYRTGDLVRYNMDGSLTLLGRNDSQVKIRGQRVDLAEIEYFIQKLEPVISAVVVEYLTLPNKQFALVATVECTDFDHATLQEKMASFRLSLSEKLPSYMIPHRYLLMTCMPKTASGKVDRKAIRQFILDGYNDTGAINPVGQPTRVLTRVCGDREALVRRLWATVLDIKTDDIDRDDSFFDLGADSISAMKLVALARREGLYMKVLDIFNNPVLRKLAAATQDPNGRPQEPGENVQGKAYSPFQLLNEIEDINSFLEEVVCPVTGTSKENIVDAYPAIDGVAINVVGATMSAQVEVPTWILDFNSTVDLEQLQESCRSLIQHVEAFRTVFVHDTRGKTLLQVVLASYPHDINCIKTEQSVGPATQALLAGRMGQRFRLGRPLVNMAIVHNEESNKTRLLFRMSHAIYDGLSLHVVWDSLRTLYLHQGAVAPQLKPFSAYLHQLLPHTTDETYQYWRNLLYGSTMPKLSGTTHPESPAPASIKFAGSKTIPVTRIKGEGITTSTIVTCAWAHVLATYTGRGDVVFGDSISGVNLVDPEIASSVVGCRATHVPVRVRFDDPENQSLLSILQQVRDQARDRIPHESLGFRSIIRDCTSWAPSTRFTSIVNHRPGNTTVHPVDGGLDFNVTVTTGDNIPLATWYDLAILSQETDGNVELTLGYSTKAFRPEEAQNLLNDVADTVGIIMKASPEWSTESALIGSRWMPKATSPFCSTAQGHGTAIKTHDGTSKGASVDVLSDVAQGLSALQKLWHSAFTSKALNGSFNGHSTPSNSDMPFYTNGGDLLDASRFKVLIEENRRKSAKAPLNDKKSTEKVSYQEVTVDDILLHPTLMEFASFMGRSSVRLE